MGLRFRRSVTLCKGVKLNFGKTGMSVSLGGKGYHKTFHQNGNVTTSVGIPGTGIYWTDTKRPNKKENRNTGNSIINNSNYSEDSSRLMGSGQADGDVRGPWVEHSIIDNNEHVIQQEYHLDDAIDTYFSEEKSESIDLSTSGSMHDEFSRNLSLEQIKTIYKSSDENVDWTEILVSMSAEDVYLEKSTWKFYKSVAGKVLKGDIDAYLDVIEYAKPLDDLLEYGGEFEFGTDSSGMMEVEFRIKLEDIIEKSEEDNVFCDYVCATTIRVARDIFALLPVGIVVVHAMRDNQTVLSVLFNRMEMNKLNFKQQPQDIINKFRHYMEYDGKIMNPVNRIDL